MLSQSSAGVSLACWRIRESHAKDAGMKILFRPTVEAISSPEEGT